MGLGPQTNPATQRSLRSRAAIRIGLAMLAATPLGGCCGASCVDGVDVEFSPPITEPGDYRVFVTASAFEEECIISVPPSGDTSTPCALLFVNRFDGDEFIGVTGFGLRFLAPELISVIIEKDSVTLADSIIRPTYEDVDGCQFETCLAGAATLHLR